MMYIECNSNWKWIPPEKNRIQTGFELSWHGKRALCKIWTKRGKSQWPPETKICEMEITTAYPRHAKPICSISIGFDRGRFVISLKCDITASHPGSYTMGAKTQCLLGRNRLPPRFIHGGRQYKLSSAEISVGKYSVYARLPSYPQPTNIAVM